MTATVLEIVEKIKTHPFGTALPENFVVRRAETLDAQIVLDHPNISLYCLDDLKREAWFVETPPDADLINAPFYYAAQYEHALRIYAVPYAEFHALAASLPAPKVIFVHSTGRCGSTLISKTFNTVPGVRSLSEPDIYLQIYFMRMLDPARDDEYRRLLKSATLFYGSAAKTVVLKFRAMVIQVGDLLCEAFPNATNLFLYRNQESWSRSMGIEATPVATRRDPVQEFPVYRRGMAPLSLPFAAEHGREATPVELTTLSWLSLMERYVALCEIGIPFLALRYEDILAHPKQVLKAAFDYCGLNGDVDSAYALFATDSQEGTLWSRASRQDWLTEPLEADEVARMRELLAGRAVVRTADFIAPHTILFADQI
ncbi:MAG: hypothetical protein ABI835_06355 [Chloroflexota bacterium]